MLHEIHTHNIKFHFRGWGRGGGEQNHKTHQDVCVDVVQVLVDVLDMGDGRARLVFVHVVQHDTLQSVPQQQRCLPCQ